MKRSLFFTVLLGALACLGSRALAQGVDSPIGVPIKVWGWGFGVNSDSSLLINVPGLPSTNCPSGDVSLSLSATIISGGIRGPTNMAEIEVQPGVTYPLYGGVTDLTVAEFFATAPPGYTVLINGESKDSYYLVDAASGTNYSGNFTLCVVGPGQFSGRAGACTSITSGQIYWQVALGSLRNGSSAGSLALIDPGTESSWAPTACTPWALQYTSPSAEIQVYNDPNNHYILRQILADQAIVDVIVVNSTCYQLKFYALSQMQGSSFPYTFTGSAYITYQVEQASTTGLKISSITSVRTAVTTLTMSKDSNSDINSYVWTLEDWNTSGQAQQVEEVRTWGGTATDRTESRIVRQPSGSTVLTVNKAYHLYDWGEEPASSSGLTLGSSNGITSNFTYDTTSSDPGYGQPLLISGNNGSWSAFDYTTANSSAGGYTVQTSVINHTYRPFNNSSSSSLSTGESTAYQYANDAFGVPTRPTSIVTQVSGQTTGQAAISYGSGSSLLTNTMTMVQATRTDYTSSGHSLQTVTKYYQEDAYDDFYRSQVSMIVHPDGSQQSFTYQRGAFSSNTFTAAAFNPSDPYPYKTNPASGIAVITGNNSSGSGGTYYTSYNGYPIEPIYLIDGKSTLQVAIRDATALVRRTESYAWVSGAWHLVGYINFSYNSAGQLTSRTALNGAAYSETYNGDQLATETDESGIVMTYSYDYAGRVSSIAKTSGPTTTYTYDAASRVLTQVLSGGTHSLTNTNTYDDAGRLASEQPAGLGTTTYTYDVSNRKRTATLPNPASYSSGVTRVETYQADGRPVSLTGTLVVEKDYSYSIDSSGYLNTTVHSGGTSSARYETTVADWAGRLLSTTRPGYTGQS